MTFGQFAFVEYVARLILIKSGFFAAMEGVPAVRNGLKRLHAHCKRSRQGVRSSPLQIAQSED